MKRGPKPKKKEQAVTPETPTPDAQAAVYGTENESKTYAPEPTGKAPQFAEYAIFLYHPDFEPRLFKKGEAIPEGWTGPKGIFKVIWNVNPKTGKWEKKP